MRKSPTSGFRDAPSSGRAAPFTLSAFVLALMVVQSTLGLVLDGEYRDVGWIRATWLGNDLVTLLGGVPLMTLALLHARRGSRRGLLLWAGMLGYAIYNYAFYMLGAALNTFFPIYVLGVVVSAVAMGLLMTSAPIATLGRLEVPRVPSRLLGSYLSLVGAGLGSVWLAMWGGFAFAGKPTPVEPDAFRLVAALDLSFMTPALTAGGMLLWRGRPWGAVVATIASVQGALYLLVLSLNAFLAVRRSQPGAGDELLTWGPLAAATAGTAAVLLAVSAGVVPAGPPNPTSDSEAHSA